MEKCGCVRRAEEGLTSWPWRTDFYMLCHARAAKPVFPYGPFKLQCVNAARFTQRELLSQRQEQTRGFSNSNYNRRAETSSGMSVHRGTNLREAGRQAGGFMAIFGVNGIEYVGKKRRFSLTLPSLNVG